MLAESDQIRDLGITLDKKMRMYLNVNAVVKNAFRTLGFVIRNCNEVGPIRDCEYAGRYQP